MHSVRSLHLEACFDLSLLRWRSGLESNMLIKHHRYLRGAEREAYMGSDFNCVCWSVWFQSFAECWHGPKPRPTGVDYRTTPLAFPSLWLAIFIWARKHPGGRVCVYIHRFDGALFIRADWDAEIDDSYCSFGLHRHTVFRDGQNWILKTLSQVTSSGGRKVWREK